MKARILCCICFAILVAFAFSGSQVYGQSTPCSSSVPSSFGGIQLGCSLNDLLKYVEKGSLTPQSRMGHCVNESICREYIHSSCRSSCSDFQRYECGKYGFGGTVIAVPEYSGGVVRKPYWKCLQKETVDKFSICEIVIDKKLLIPAANTGGCFIFSNNKLVYFGIMFRDDQSYKDLCANLEEKFGRCKTIPELGNTRFNFATDGNRGLAYGGHIGAFHGSIRFFNLDEWAKIIDYDKIISQRIADKASAARDAEKQKLNGLFK